MVQTTPVMVEEGANQVAGRCGRSQIGLLHGRVLDSHVNDIAERAYGPPLCRLGGRLVPSRSDLGQQRSSRYQWK